MVLKKSIISFLILKVFNLKNLRIQMPLQHEVVVLHVTFAYAHAHFWTY